MRIALAYAWYMYCMAGLIELRLSYVWLRQCRFVFRRSSCCIQQVVVEAVPTTFFALLIGEV